MLCNLCIDCDDYGCSGKECHKKGNRCIITDDCFKECEDGIGGFIGKIPIFDFDINDRKMSALRSNKHI